MLFFCIVSPELNDPLNNNVMIKLLYIQPKGCARSVHQSVLVHKLNLNIIHYNRYQKMHNDDGLAPLLFIIIIFITIRK